MSNLGINSDFTTDFTARDKLLESLTPEEKARIAPVMKEVEEFSAKITQEIKKTGKLSEESIEKANQLSKKAAHAVFDPNGDGIVDEREAKRIAEALFPKKELNDSELKLVTAGLKDLRHKIGNSEDPVFISPKNILEGGEIGIKHLTEGLTMPDSSLKIIMDQVKPIINSVTSVMNGEVFDRGENYVTKSGTLLKVGKDDGVISKEEMLMAIHKINEQGSKVNSREELEELTKGKNVSKEVLDAGWKYQESLGRLSEKSAKDNSNELVPPLQTPQRQAPAQKIEGRT